MPVPPVAPAKNGLICSARAGLPVRTRRLSRPFVPFPLPFVIFLMF